MRIKHELFKYDNEKPPFNVSIYVPGFKFDYKKIYDEIDLVVELPTVLEACKYEYGYTCTVKILGFGFSVWIGRNI